jgi:hypothetical protein
MTCIARVLLVFFPFPKNLADQCIGKSHNNFPAYLYRLELIVALKIQTRKEI